MVRACHAAGDDDWQAQEPVRAGAAKRIPQTAIETTACHRQVETANHVSITSAESSRSAQRAGTSAKEDRRVIWAPTLAPKVGAFSCSSPSAFLARRRWLRTWGLGRWHQILAVERKARSIRAGAGQIIRSTGDAAGRYTDSLSAVSYRSPPFVAEAEADARPCPKGHTANA